MAFPWHGDSELTHPNTFTGTGERKRLNEGPPCHAPVKSGVCEVPGWGRVFLNPCAVAVQVRR